MKKNLYILAFTLLLSNISFAQNQQYDFEAMAHMVEKPNTQEIMQIINRFEMSDEQKQQVYNMVNEQLEILYNSNSTIEPQIEIEETSIQKKNIHPQIENNSYEQQNTQNYNNNQSKTYTKPKREKKYSKHPPLTRRSKQN